MISIRDVRIAFLFAWPVLGGCAAPGPSFTGHSTVDVPGADRESVFAAAELSLEQRGYRIERRDISAGRLVAVPIHDARPGRPAHGPARLSSRSRTRRMVQVRVEQAGGVVSVLCNVAVQEQTTQAHRLFAHERLSYDMPTDTPIEREAASTREQATVWRTIRRDTAGEREILEAIAAAAAPDARSGPP